MENINNLVAISICRAHSNFVPTTTNAAHGLPERLAIIFSRKGDVDRAVNEALRTTRNFSFLPSLKALRQVCELGSSPTDSESASRLRLKFLNGPLADPRDLIDGFDVVETGILRRLLRRYSGTTANVISALHLDGSTHNISDADPRLKKAISALCELKHRHNVESLAELADDLTLPRPLRTTISLLLASKFIDLGRLGDAVCLIAHEFVLEPPIKRVLPVANIIGSDGWKKLRPYADQISVLIIFDLQWRETNDDKLATYRRFATQQFLAKSLVKRPSELEPRANDFGRAELVYFLENICVASVLDMLPTFTNSQELDEERRAICNALLKLNPRNAQRYETEILEITNRMILETGLRFVDSSRVHVDEDGLTRWAVRELEEPYYRYESLVDAGIGIADDFDQVLRNIFRSNFRDYLQVPESEADELLIVLITLLRGRFLFDASFGLDSYLSQRIRHGSIQNYLRSPVEGAHLVTQKDAKTNTYQRNNYWAEKLDCSREQRDELDDAFRSFSKEIDGIIVDLRNKFLNVHSSEKPDGLLKMELLAPAFHLLRSAIQHGKGIEHVVRNCVSVFWAVLGPSLAETQSFLTGRVKHQLAFAFERLRTSLFEVAGDHPEFAGLSTALGDTSAKMQTELDRIAGWFQRREERTSQLTYTLGQAFQIAIESALSTHKAFAPIMQSNIVPGLSVAANDLIVLADIVRVALGNVHEHAQTKRSPTVAIDTYLSPSGQQLTVRFRSDIGANVRDEAAEAKVESIRAQITDGSYVQKVRSEGGSGLLKIANLILRTAEGRLNFFFDGHTHFVLEMEFPLTRQEEHEGSHDGLAHCRR
jgi:hypothetical protein